MASLGKYTVKGEKKWKVNKIISSTFLSPHSRQGVQMKHTPNSLLDYVHWGDPNVLVDRRRLLMASQSSGHSGHINEIVSIVEELREAGIII